jgi:hypothetical protein
MTSRQVAAALLVAAAGCSSGGKAAPAPDPLREDLERICNAYALSGADQDPSANGTYLLATWLDANVTSEAGRAFLVEFAQLGQDRAARVAKLEEAQRRVGLASCPLVAHWR